VSIVFTHILLAQKLFTTTVSTPDVRLVERNEMIAYGVSVKLGTALTVPCFNLQFRIFAGVTGVKPPPQ
jgi:hypothetical protein